MLRSTIIAVGAVFLLPAPLLLAASATPAPVPSRPATPYWTVGRNDAVVTARDTVSKVWADIVHGSIGESYYPTINVADSRTIEFIVVHNGHAVPVSAMTHRYSLVSHKALAVNIVNTPASKAYQLDETIFTNPHANSIVMEYHIKIRSGSLNDYHLYLFSNPHLNNLGTDNTGLTAQIQNHTVLEARNGTVSSAIVSNPSFIKTSNGYLNSNDGLTQLLSTGHLTSYTQATGNIGQTGEIPLSRGADRQASGEVVIAYGNQIPTAVQTAMSTLGHPAQSLLGKFVAQWHHYLAPLYHPHGLSAGLLNQYWLSLMTIKAAEDKTSVGAMAASLSTPWGESVPATTSSVTGYHMVWVRDAYQMASALLAAGDRRTASQILHWFFSVDQYSNGNFPQNSFANGTPFWIGQELDQDGFPVILAYQLGQDGPGTYKQHIEPALNYILAHGPWTQLDRWEESSGFSPNTMAVDIAALALGAQIARQDGHPSQAQVYQAVARHWLNHLQSWTVTTNGPLSSRPYFVRISTAPNANNPSNTITIANGGSTYPQNAIVDQGFLSLVRLGLISPADPVVIHSLSVIDHTIRVQTPNGPGFHRYNHDRYGNYANGAPYNGSGYGGLWPVLGGERGEYDLAAHLQGVQSAHSPLYYLQTMKNMAYGLGMIPEQVWPFSTAIPRSPAGTNPATASIGLKPGVATGSAAPLNWAMAQYVRLAIDISKNQLVDQPRILHKEFNLTNPMPSTLPLSANFSDGHSAPVPATGMYSVDSGNWIVHSQQGTLSGQAAPGAAIAAAVVSNNGIKITTTTANSQGRYSVPVSISSALQTVEVTEKSGNMTKALSEVVSYSTPPMAAWRNLPFDDLGPGFYQYPTGSWFVPGMLDMTSVSLHQSGNSDVVNVSYDVLNNIYGAPNGFSTKLLEIYLVNPATSGGSTAALPYANVGFSTPWNYALRVSGWDTKLVNAQGTVLSRNLTVTTNSLTHTVSIQIPSSLIGSFKPGWGLYVTTLSQDGYAPGEVRPISAQPGPYNFGYVKADPTGYPTNVMDVLTPSGTPQQALNYLHGPIILRAVTIP
ncbi:MAG: glycoside hydrolase family 15 protein [Firmicutes bacterium]|uniref:Glucan 1,4-alpha-glucosidase n=1 Tax=Sulfobacillus benefaciens TaxID=453960 RepID=A0A2T2WTY8_9FIRM|nr:glycoside hydrolase family 15 protein [Bacillota bacterium]PSR25682.1 MAG: hypothetical protein C7B43_16320 [Sulfobacillus benefaciens]